MELNLHRPDVFSGLLQGLLQGSVPAWVLFPLCYTLITYVPQVLNNHCLLFANDTRV